MNIKSLGDLLKTTEQELLAYKNFGETSLNEIKALLAQKGLRLGQAAGDGAVDVLRRRRRRPRRSPQRGAGDPDL
jgi:DNA-directed RNA polymerase subunit alpha